MTDFKTWFKENLSESAADIAEHGADAGYPHITYNNEAAALFDRFASEIWDMAVGDADSMGHKNVAEMISTFSRSDMV